MKQYGVGGQEVTPQDLERQQQEQALSQPGSYTPNATGTGYDYAAPSAGGSVGPRGIDVRTPNMGGTNPALGGAPGLIPSTGVPGLPGSGGTGTEAAPPPTESPAMIGLHSAAQPQQPLPEMNEIGMASGGSAGLGQRTPPQSVRTLSLLGRRLF